MAIVAGGGSNFVLEPGLVGSNMETAVLSGLWFFNEKVNKKMTINDNTPVEKVTKKINPKLNGIDNRKRLYHLAKSLLKDC